MREILRSWPLVAWLGYLIVRVPGWGLFSGRPLDWLGLVTVSLVAWLWWSRRRLPLAPILLVAIGAKLACGPVLAPRGFSARYYAEENWRGPVERSAEAAGDHTRIDTRLAFGDRYGTDLPVHFFNDAGRFNFYLPSQPIRDKLAFSVSWEGSFQAAVAEPRQMYVRGAGMVTRIAISDRPPITVPPGESDWRTALQIVPGWQRLRIEVSAPYGAARRFEAGWVREGRREPFEAGEIFQQPVSGLRLVIDRLIRAASRLFDVALLVTVLFGAASTIARVVHVLRDGAGADRAAATHAWSTLVAAVAIADAAVFALPVFGRTVMLSGGDDWLAYEMMAREILLNGPLMLFGTQIGHGFGYYWHPFYPYFLAICHWLTGDGLFGIYFVQRFLLGVTVILLWLITDWLFGLETGRAGLAVALVVVYERIAHWADYLLSDVLFIPLIVGWALLLVRVLRRPTLRTSAVVPAGVLWGLATLTRGTPLLGIFLVLPWFAHASYRRFRTWWRPTALLLATMLAVVSMATLRNYYVARQFIPIFTSGANSLIIGNPPPPSVQLGAGPRDWLYQRLNIDPPTRAVAEYAIQAPKAFAQGLARKVWYLLGWFDSLLPGTGRSLFLIAWWIAAAAGLLWMVYGGVPPDGTRAARVIPLAVASVHLTSVIVVFPHVYGDRLILPVYALVVPYAAVAVAAICRLAARLGREMLQRIVLCAALLLCGAEAATGRLGFDFSMFFPAMLIASLALGERIKGGVRLWAIVALAVALTTTLLLAPSADAVVEYRRQLAFVALAPVVAPLAVSIQTRWLAVGVLLAVLGIGAAAALAVLGQQVWRPLWQEVPFAATCVVAGLTGVALVWMLWRRRSEGEWSVTVGFVAGVLLMVGALQWLAASIGTLNDTISLYLWTWVARGPILAGHEWWFGRGLAGPSDLVNVKVSGFGAGGLMLWFLVSTGVIGAATYVAVWVRALWLSAHPLTDWRCFALNGILLGAFAFSQSRNVLAGPTAIPALLALLGLTLGLVESNSYVSAHRVQSHHS